MLCYIMPIKRIREPRVSIHWLIYSFLFFKLLLGFRLDFEFGLGSTSAAFIINACWRQAEIASVKLFFGLTCPTGKLTKYSA